MSMSKTTTKTLCTKAYDTDSLLNSESCIRRLNAKSSKTGVFIQNLTIKIII